MTMVTVVANQGSVYVDQTSVEVSLVKDQYILKGQVDQDSNRLLLNHSNNSIARRSKQKNRESNSNDRNKNKRLNDKHGANPLQ